MIFHVVGLPSCRTNSQSSCVFTALTANFVKMMRSLGHSVYHYGVGCDIACTEDVVVAPPVEMDWSGKAFWWTAYNRRIAAEINKRKTVGDFVCIINGWLNKELESIQGVLLVEYACGYNGTFANYRVFASYAHQNKIYGAEGGFDPDGRWYDEVIPHYIDPQDYNNSCRCVKDDYYLYIGRITPRKGIQIAIDTCKYLNKPLKIAGPGCEPHTDGVVEYLGPVTGQQKVDLYSGAIATFVPTQYLEPFGMTSLESQICGTPIITSNFGSFPEIVVNGLNGYRCRNFKEFVVAAKSVSDLSPAIIVNYAAKTWGVDTVKYQYQDYFHTLSNLWDKGWYALPTNL